jgi:hypothetical protein
MEHIAGVPGDEVADLRYTALGIDDGSELV